MCLGGAFELALACHYRVLADNDKTKVGLPEIKVGLFPGAGGTQRVARLMPTGDALQFLFKGEQIKAKAAKAAGLAHELAPEGEIVERARAWIIGGGKAARPGTQKDFKAPSGRVFSPGGMMIWPPANAIYRRETYDNYPAAKAILHSVYEGLQLPMDQALTVEARWFAHILRSKEAAAMIRSLFLSKNELDKGAHRPKDVPPTNLKKIGILGAGFMGAGVAYVSAQQRARGGADRPRSGERRQGQGRLRKADRRTGSRKGRATAADQATRCSRASRRPPITPRLKGCDLVLEAVFEDRGVKAEATQARAGGRSDPTWSSPPTRRRCRSPRSPQTSRPPGQFHRHSFLFAGRKNAARRNHPRQGNGRSRAGDGARFRAHHQEDADRRQ